MGKASILGGEEESKEAKPFWAGGYGKIKNC